MKTTGRSLKGAKRSRTVSSKSRAVLVSLFSTKSHLLTAITTPLFRFWAMRKMARSWLSTPSVASIISTTMSAASMARMARITL